ncbi:MAG: BamA/TamA family outer membrane protein [Kofleriaceae bacterium]
MRFATFCLAVALGLGVTARAADADTIREILVEENTKTDDDTVALIAQIDVGDDWSGDMNESVKKRLLQSGLFKDAEVFSSQVEGGVRITITVHDKHSWVVAPALYLQPTNKGAGVGFGENNLFGQNQKLLIYAQVASGDTFFLGAWVIPSIAGSRFYAQFDTYLKQARMIEYATPDAYLSSPVPVRESRMNYFNGGVRLGVEPIRGWRIDTRLRAAKVSFPDDSLFSDSPALKYLGKDPANAVNDVGTPADMLVAPGADGLDVSNEIALTIDRRASYLGVSTGKKYQIWFEHSLESLGSDFNYYSLSASFFRGWQVLERHNFILRLTGNYGHHLPFQQEFTLGGTTMRGYVNNQFRGDVRGLANVEYSFPFIGVGGFSIRGLAFFDSGYTTFLTTSNPDRNYLPGARRDQHPNFSGFKNSVGIGTRFYLQQIVLPLLGVDFGYGLEARDFQIYLAIGLTD